MVLEDFAPRQTRRLSAVERCGIELSAESLASAGFGEGVAHAKEQGLQGFQFCRR
jgi:hypothetical protein